MKPLTFFFSLCLASSLLSAEEVPLNSFIEAKLKEYEVPGAVVVIVEAGKPPYVQGFGFTNLETQQKVDGNTLFQLASVTKTFTGALFGVAMDRKEIGFDQPVKEVFSQFRLHDDYATKWATVVDLLSHRSGLPAFGGGLLEMLGYNQEEIIQKVHEIPLEPSFRDHAAYSNISYFLAGEATAQAARQPWISLIKSRLLNPLQMNSTGLAADVMPHSVNAALPYALTPEGKLLPTQPNHQVTLSPAGALASTGNDMAKYLQMWLQESRRADGPVISKDSVEKLLTPIIAEELGFAELPPISEQTGFDYTAGGWGEFHFQNHSVFEKGGALEGYRTVVVLVPEKKWGVAILCNRNLTIFPEAVRAELLERLLGRSNEDTQAAIWERQAKVDQLLAPIQRPLDATPATVPLSAFVGTYSNPHYGEWRVIEKNGSLTFEAGPARLVGKLTPWSGNDFLVTWPLINAGKAIAEFQSSGEKVTGFTFDEKFRFHRKSQ